MSKYDAERNRLLAEADRQAHDGPYRPDWSTLNKYEQPQWYKDAKFGIFIHWGVYSVPAAENEWYPRNMYNPKDGAHKNFEEHYGHEDPSKGYKDLIPLFRAEHFNAGEWAKLFKEAGAQYVVPVAEHHDGFSMYDSGLSDWTVVKMGPKRDTLAELAAAVRAEGLHFGFSSHRAEHNFFYSYGRTTRSDVNDPNYASLYGPAHQWLAPGGDEHGMINDWTYVSDAWTRDWLARDTELVEKYKPEIVYFDWWIGQPKLPQSCYGVRCVLLQLRGGARLYGRYRFQGLFAELEGGDARFRARAAGPHHRRSLADRYFDQQRVVGVHRARHLQVA